MSGYADGIYIARFKTMIRNILDNLSLGAAQFPFALFAPFVGLFMFFQNGSNVSSGVAAGVTAAIVGLLGSALHIWFNNRKLTVSSGMDRDKQIDERTVRLFDQMEEHYKELLRDKDGTIKSLNGLLKQKDNIIEGYRQLGSSQILVNQMPPPAPVTSPVAEPAPSV